MMLRTIIVDDEAPSRRRIKKLLLRHPEITLTGEAQSGREALELLKQTPADLVLLDIQLKDMTGFEVLQQLQPLRFGVVFITAYDEFAVSAFEQNAIDYLLKPYNERRFDEALIRAKTRFENRDLQQLAQLLNQLPRNTGSEKITIPEGKRTHLIAPHEVLFVKADGYHSQFQLLDGGKKVIRISLKHLEEILPAGFFRIGRSVIINKDHVESYKRRKRDLEILLVGGYEFVTDRDISF